MEDTVVVSVPNADPLLESVLKLYRKNAKTLGFLPRGAMEEFAQKGHVLALQKGADVAGYAAWRESGNEAVLVHLCIDEPYRSLGNSKTLMGKVIELCRDLRAIRLSCRKDYEEANRLWPRLGFECSDERTGRGVEGEALLIWRRVNSVESLPLIDLIRSKQRVARYKAVVDANVFFDLISPGSGNEESRGLLANWLDDVELCITPELKNEIARRGSQAERKQARQKCRQFVSVDGHPDELELTVEKICQVLPNPKTESDESDRRQLAHSILGDADFFVTRDTDFLDHADDLNAEFNIVVIRPSDFVVYIDSQERPEPYAPARLSGSNVMSWLATSEEELLKFQDFRRREQKASWLDKVRELRSDPRHCDVRLFGPRGDARVALGVSRQNNESIDIRLLRALSGSLTSTLLRRAVANVMEEALKGGRSVVRVFETVSPLVKEALLDLNFRSHPGGYYRYVVRGTVALPQAKQMIEQVAGSGALVDLSIPSEAEMVFWPLKILNAGTPSFLVPIQPLWAERLFDRKLAEGLLIPVDEGPALSLENVFYSGSNIDIPAGSRIVWYVSSERGRMDRQVRAVSICLGTIVAPAKTLAKQFSRLGVYRWKRILALAKGDPNKILRAYRFAYTELLERPIYHMSMKAAILEYMDTRNNVAGPLKIPESLFTHLYQRGMCLGEK